MDRKEVSVVLAVVVIVAAALAFSYATEDRQDGEVSITATVIGIDDYTSPILDISMQDLTDAGFSYGDYVNIDIGIIHNINSLLTNGYNALGFYDTFIADDGGEIHVGLFGGTLPPVDIGETAYLVKVGVCPYYDKLEMTSQGIVNDPSRYDDDEMLANFYQVTGGSIADGKLYRGCNPFRDVAVNPRAPYVDDAAEDHGIAFLISLSFDETSIHDLPTQFDGSYCKGLVDRGNYIAPGMTQDFLHDNGLKDVFLSIIENDGPYMVHCNEGRDRTGAVCMMLQALCGATEEEMVEGYLQSFVNLHLVVPGSEEYDLIRTFTFDRLVYLFGDPSRLDDVLSIDWTSIDISDVDINAAVYGYVIDVVGLTSDQVDALVEKLSA